jgi:hypothetical protein
MAKKTPSPDSRLILLAAKWAARLELPPGNLWEPALVTSMRREVTRLGGDANAYAFVEALTAQRLGFQVES